MSAESSRLGQGDDAPLLGRSSGHGEAKFDITAMIDLVFMMNIYFLVTMVTAALEDINLPTAKHCAPADRDLSVIVSILENPDGGAGLVFVGDEPSGEPLRELTDQERRVRAAVEEGVKEKKTTFLIRAERNVRLREIARIGGWAASAPGLEFKLAVIEQE